MSCIFTSCNFMSCNFMSSNFTQCYLVRHFHVLHFHALLLGPSFSCPVISCPAILMVRHFHVRHFQSTQIYDGSKFTNIISQHVNSYCVETILDITIQKADAVQTCLSCIAKKCAARVHEGSSRQRKSAKTMDEWTVLRLSYAVIITRDNSTVFDHETRRLKSLTVTK